MLSAAKHATAAWLQGRRLRRLLYLRIVLLFCSIQEPEETFASDRDIVHYIIACLRGLQEISFFFEAPRLMQDFLERFSELQDSSLRTLFGNFGASEPRSCMSSRWGWPCWS